MASGTGIGEFYVSLFVDAAEGGLTVGNLVQGFGQLEIATLGEIALLWELGTMLARVTDAGIKASLGFEQFTMHTGLSAQELQHWQIVAEQSHASAQDVTGSVENLTKHLANLAIGIPDASLGALQQLGISAFDSSGKLKTAFDILGEVRTRLGAVTQDAGQQERILAGLGISPNLRETMLLSESMFQSRRNLVPGMSEDQEASLDKLRQTFVEIQLKAMQLGIDLASNISPELESMAKWTAMILEDFILIAKEILHFAPIKALMNIGGASLSSVGDLLNAVAGKGLDVNDLNEQGKKIGSAYSDLHNLFGPLFFPESEAQLKSYPPTQVSIDKHDTYVIQEANNPEKIKQVLEQHWDDTLRQKTVDGFDRQHNNGGY